MSTSTEGVAEAGPHPNCALCRLNWWAKRGARSRYLSGPVVVAASARANYLQVHHPAGCPAPPTASYLRGPCPVDLPTGTVPHDCAAGQYVHFCHNKRCAAIPEHVRAGEIVTFARLAARMDVVRRIKEELWQQAGADYSRPLADPDAPDPVDEYLRDPNAFAVLVEEITAGLGRLLPQVTPGHPQNTTPAHLQDDPVYLAGVADAVRLNTATATLLLGNRGRRDAYARLGVRPRYPGPPPWPQTPRLSYLTARAEVVLTDPTLFTALNGYREHLTADATGPTLWASFDRTVIAALEGRSELAPGVHILRGDDWPKTRTEWEMFLTVWRSANPDEPLGDPAVAWNAIRDAMTLSW